MPEGELVEIVNDREGGRVAERGAALEHDVRFVEFDSGQGVQGLAVKDAEVIRSGARDAQRLGVIGMISLGNIVL